VKSKPPEDVPNPPDRPIRLDIWLWSSRFYTTRKIATEAIKGGHISVNGQKGKPGKAVKIGDKLIIKKFSQHYHITILGLSEKRLGAPLAQALYEESEQSKQLRERNLALQKQLHQSVRYDKRKPGKRDRRRMLAFKRQNMEI